LRSIRTANRAFPWTDFFDIPADRAKIVENFFGFIQIIQNFFVEFCMDFLCLFANVKGSTAAYSLQLRIF
jgi:hypothetical protein